MGGVFCFGSLAGGGGAAGVSGAADHTLRSRPSGEADKKNGDAILIGGGACQGLEGRPGCVSQRSGCQEPGETGGEGA